MLQMWSAILPCQSNWSTLLVALEDSLLRWGTWYGVHALVTLSTAPARNARPSIPLPIATMRMLWNVVDGLVVVAIMATNDDHLHRSVS